MPYMTKDSEIPAKGKGSKLTAKMERFVEEYMIDLNASEAVVRAGYKTRNKNKMGAELLRHPLVRQKVDELKGERRDRLELTSDYVINKLVDIVEKTERGNPTAALRGLELLGKHLGLYRDKQEISGPDGGAIQTEQRVKEDVADFTSQLTRLIKRGGTDEVVEFPKRDGDSGA
jgi:phage terminase small subunit